LQNIFVLIVQQLVLLKKQYSSVHKSLSELQEDYKTLEEKIRHEQSVHRHTAHAQRRKGSLADELRSSSGGMPAIAVQPDPAALESAKTSLQAITAERDKASEATDQLRSKLSQLKVRNRRRCWHFWLKCGICPPGRACSDQFGH